MEMHTEKEEIKVSFFIVDMIIYMSDPQNFIRELFHQINTFSKVAGYNIRKKSLFFLYTN